MLSDDYTEGEQDYSLLNRFYWHHQETRLYSTKNRNTGIGFFVGGHMVSIKSSPQIVTYSHHINGAPWAKG